jgi:hypothetical protein
MFISLNGFGLVLTKNRLEITITEVCFRPRAEEIFDKQNVLSYQ